MASDKKTSSARRSKAAAEGYDAADITVLEGLEAVRKRPGMYIGSTGAAGPAPPGLRGGGQLGRRGAGRALRRGLGGIHPDNSVTVTDNGRGIPVAMHDKEKRPAVEVVLTVLHSGGKFGDGGGYKVSGGLHGVGVSVVNALSEMLHVEIRRDGATWTQDYERGAPRATLHKGRRPRRPGPPSPSCPTRTSSSRWTTSSTRSSSACRRRPS